MFWLLILSAWTLLHAYVFWRAASVPAVSRRIAPRWVAARVSPITEEILRITLRSPSASPSQPP